MRGGDWEVYVYFNSCVYPFCFVWGSWEIILSSDLATRLGNETWWYLTYF